MKETIFRLNIYIFSVCLDASGYSLIWHLTTGQVLSKQKEHRQTLAAAVAPGCETFCTGGSDGSLFVYDASTHTKIRTLEPRSVRTLATVPNPSPLLTHSQSSTLMDGHANRVFSSRYHPANPSLLISAGWDDTIQASQSNLYFKWSFCISLQFWDIRHSQAIR